MTRFAGALAALLILASLGCNPKIEGLETQDGGAEKGPRAITKPAEAGRGGGGSAEGSKSGPGGGPPPGVGGPPPGKGDAALGPQAKGSPEIPIDPIERFAREANVDLQGVREAMSTARGLKEQRVDQAIAGIFGNLERNAQAEAGRGLAPDERIVGQRELEASQCALMKAWATQDRPPTAEDAAPYVRGRLLDRLPPGAKATAAGELLDLAGSLRETVSAGKEPADAEEAFVALTSYVCGFHRGAA